MMEGLQNCLGNSGDETNTVTVRDITPVFSVMTGIL
jgi:hypothetical protein